LLVVSFSGGLGNQLFQYAAARYVAHVRGQCVWADISHYSTNAHSGRRFGIVDFNANIERVIDLSASDAETLRGSLADAKSEDDGQEPSVLLTKAETLWMTGGWASKNRYLFADQHFSRLLKRELTPRSFSRSSAFDELKSKIDRSCNPVFVHVRRGDYLDATEIFHLVDETYYNAAFATIEDAVGTAEFFVFSDEVEYVARTMQFGREVTYGMNLDPIETIELARRCRHFVAANSTFSWWCSYLGEMPNSLVIFPLKYYTNERWQKSHEMDTDYLSESWRKL
jgi:hypothetical protein